MLGFTGGSGVSERRSPRRQGRRRHCGDGGRCVLLGWRLEVIPLQSGEVDPLSDRLFRSLLKTREAKRSRSLRHAASQLEPSGQTSLQIIPALVDLHGSWGDLAGYVPIREGWPPEFALSTSAVWTFGRFCAINALLRSTRITVRCSSFCLNA